MRLFVAIRPPAPVRDALLDAMDERPGVRWQDEDQLHLTLAFLGEVDPRVEQDLVDSLAAIRLPPFEVTIRGVGHFEHKGVPSTLWAGLAPSEPLARLQARVVAACRRASSNSPSDVCAGAGRTQSRFSNEGSAPSWARPRSAASTRTVSWSKR